VPTRRGCLPNNGSLASGDSLFIVAGQSFPFAALSSLSYRVGMIRPLRTLALGIGLVTACSALLLTDARAAGKRQPGTVRGPNKIHTHRLANGMTVLVEQDFRAPVAAFAIWYGVGSRDDPAGQLGTTGIVARMMQQRTSHLADGVYQDTLARAGAREVTDFVGADYTILRATVPSNRLALPMWLWSDQMGFFVPAASDDNLSRQKESLRVEWKHKVEGAPKAKAYAAAWREVFGTAHPYHRDAVAPPHEIDTVRLSDVQTFHQKWFVPNNAVLAVSGLVDPKAVFALAEKYFGPIPAGPPCTRVSSLPASLSDDVVLEAIAPIPRPEVAVYWPTPGLEEPGDYELDVLAKILDGEQVAWLTWKLIDEQKVADNAWAGQSSRDQASTFHVHVNVAQGHSPEEVLSAFDAQIARAADPALSEYEVRRAANEIGVREMFSYQRPWDRIGRYAACQMRYADPDCLLWRTNRLDNMTPADIRKAASELKASGRVILFIRPNPSAPLSGAVVSRQTRKHQ